MAKSPQRLGKTMIGRIAVRRSARSREQPPVGHFKIIRHEIGGLGLKSAITLKWLFANPVNVRSAASSTAGYALNGQALERRCSGCR